LRSRRFQVPPGIEDWFAGSLWQAGSLGQEIVARADGGTEVIAYFDRDAPAPPEWSSRGVRLVAEEEVLERDWQEEFRRHALPFAVGRRLIIDPGEPGGRFLLCLPAREAFGTGTHESTRLALELLEVLGPGPGRVLDVGTGTGVLALAALLFGASDALAFDCDLAAAFAARDNARRNQVPRCLVFAGDIGAVRENVGFDVALCNVVPSEARSFLPALVARLRRGGTAVFSGVLVAESPAWRQELIAAGLTPEREHCAGEWAAFLARRA
jgi:ribosomal protein L11 methyltransferase